MSVVVPIISASGAKSTVTLPSIAVGTTGRVPAYPAFPDATNTGLTGAVTAWTGSYEFRTAGQVIEGKSFSCTAANTPYITASNVTFRNCKFTYTDTLDATWTMVDNEGTGTYFESCEFDGKSKCARAIWGDGMNLTVRWCNIHHTGNAIEANPVLVEENYIHDINEPAGTSWHADGIQASQLGYDNLTIRHNTVIMTHPATSAINVPGSPSNPSTNVLIEKNLLAGGGYTMYTANSVNYQILNNHFSTVNFPKVGEFNIWYNQPMGDVRQGNIIHETGAPANGNI